MLTDFYFCMQETQKPPLHANNKQKAEQNVKTNNSSRRAWDAGQIEAPKIGETIRQMQRTTYLSRDSGGETARRTSAKGRKTKAAIK